MVTDRLAFGPATTTITNTAAPTAGNAQPSAGTSASGPLQNFSLYEKALQIIRKNYVGRSDLTDQQLLDGSIAGLVNALGDTGHSYYLSAAEYKAWQSQLSDSLAGVGVVLSTDNSAFTVTKVLPDSPAEKSGVKAGDQITAVDGASLEGLTYDQVAARIRGQAGTKVTLTLVRPGVAQPIVMTITRAVLTVPLVRWGMVPGTKIADVELIEFSANASTQLAAAIKSATSAGATGLILDLRGNPGGYAQQAIDVASQFISTGAVFLTEDANGKRTSANVNTKVPQTSLPLVVLVDHDSASASEIVAGALQDDKRARIVGETTFGTGTVTQPFSLPDGSAIILGTAYWLTPNGNRIYHKGITPDESVANAPGVTLADPSTFGSMTTAQFSASGDAQLLAAVKDLSH